MHDQTKKASLPNGHVHTSDCYTDVFSKQIAGMQVTHSPCVATCLLLDVSEFHFMSSISLGGSFWLLTVFATLPLLPFPFTGTTVCPEGHLAGHTMHQQQNSAFRWMLIASWSSCWFLAVSPLSCCAWFCPLLFEPPGGPRGSSRERIVFYNKLRRAEGPRSVAVGGLLFILN